MNRPEVIALDVIETLFSLEPLGARFKQAGLPEAAMHLFFAQMLRDSFALEASRVYKPFREIAAGSLAVVMATNGVSPDQPKLESVLAGFAELPAHPDVAAGLERLHRSGVRLITLTNGGAENTKKLLARSGLERFIERAVSIDEVRHWKPNREVYLHAARVSGVAPERMTLVAAHAWDVHGAKQAGLRAAWVKRQDTLYQPAMSPPDVQGDSINAVAEALLA
jgi:2-haloacid dehalogenase